MEFRMQVSSVQPQEVATAIAAFDRRFGEMERVIWSLSRGCRKELVESQGTNLLQGLVWLVKSWMGVQGVRTTVKEIAARALLTLSWTPELFEESGSYSGAEEQFARDRVDTMVGVMQQFGAERREYSLASKVLHWIIPWRIPVYDKYVRDMLFVTTAHPDRAYSEVVSWEFAAARRLNLRDSDWIGGFDPRSPLRAIDKYLWWKGGGETGHALVVSDPWKAVRHLGITPAS
jgi:hypothetical protein